MRAASVMLQAMPSAVQRVRSCAMQQMALRLWGLPQALLVPQPALASTPPQPKCSHA